MQRNATHRAPARATNVARSAHTMATRRNTPAPPACASDARWARNCARGNSSFLRSVCLSTCAVRAWNCLPTCSSSSGGTSRNRRRLLQAARLAAAARMSKLLTAAPASTSSSSGSTHSHSFSVFFETSSSSSSAAAAQQQRQQQPRDADAAPAASQEQRQRAAVAAAQTDGASPVAQKDTDCDNKNQRSVAGCRARRFLR